MFVAQREVEIYRRRLDRVNGKHSISTEIEVLGIHHRPVDS
jgi:hypothetical protein